MEIAIDPTQMWHNFVQFVLDYKLLASLFLVVLLHFFKKGTLRLIKRRSSRKGEDRRNQINILEQLGNAFIIVLLMMVWSSEIQNLAISIAAFMVAIVLATREFIQCFMGFIYYLGARPFRVGDWIQMNNVIGEVVEMDWAKTALLEVDPETFNYTGKHVYVPNSQLVTQTVRNLNFLRRYKLHSFNIVNEPTVNAYSLLPAFRASAQAHCEYFRDVAERYKGLIERHLEQDFIQIDPEVEIKTNELAKVVVKVSLFCPTAEAHELEHKMCSDWLSLWFEALEKSACPPNTSSSSQSLGETV
ncbi:mechanosensitive ion channel protein MscS [Alteromonas sp. KS69]|jgi:MscS family membrane protein|uniref:mechanosensitive ion channel family protein n=1 Tax=Alteromonas sp. KS69 TaxID=2109917 RepID=UPI000F88AFE1|nr:mechanosensitive ion channel family protein [Alteromonas sp. KS69]RUP81991.1 mechanosensitive ion channel protein MscS [Alteromonas sp. KS69]|tara:strand:- start:6779 stop:7684 length:906 start_codon:yes stop_codon:yes gene_type:complete